MLVFKCCLRPLVLAVVRIFFVSTATYAMDVSFAWDANTEEDVIGYYLYYKTGSSGEPYNGTDALEGPSPVYIEGRNTTTYTLTGLDDTENYYFVLTAYDWEDFESDYSIELIKISPQTRLEIDQKIETYKQGNPTDQDIIYAIQQYMEMF